MTLYEPVIGLEVHAELLTQSKMFCGCAVVDSTQAEPNTVTCPVCTAMPGVLPVVNRRAVEFAMMAALALHCEIRPQNVFARKNYLYPDLPKGYQISQYELPLAVNGYLDIESAAGRKRVGVRRVHLEEDTGKLYHIAGASLVDYNRSGVPLMEIVSEPDLHSVEDVRLYAEGLRAILRYLGVNNGDMEKGVIRFEANISVRLAGSDRLNTRTEVKNLNSFRALVRAAEYEIARQSALLARGEAVVQ
ncbi:MAG: Asp-tRNA(Asn)/Glu-tRNA(Gln) amidotransferase subunit GatB, partial [Chloroflexi bacterium]|nr:Asp-tRNA(Asn)/Glu-tRNA(Gln) amidotransferase subunit GatB [Chloroflexota bacterium]